MPRYQQIARQLKNAIEKGELKPGRKTALLSSGPGPRSWGSGWTVENAYAGGLGGAGLARATRAGRNICCSEQLRPENAPVSPAIFAGENPRPQPFQMGLPALDLFPRDVWARVMVALVPRPNAF